MNNLKVKITAKITNIEKAEELYHRWCYEDDNEIGCVDDFLVEMAKWKDEQLLKELSKLSLSSNPHDYIVWVYNKEKELREQLGQLKNLKNKNHGN